MKIGIPFILPRTILLLSTKNKYKLFNKSQKKSTKK